MAHRLGLLVNPAAGRGRARSLAGRVIERITEIFPEPIVRFTETRGDGTLKTRALLDAGAEVIACLGGDGTFREASEALAGTGVPMAILPCGRGNDLPRSVFGKKMSISDAIKIMREPKERVLDLGFLRSRELSFAFAVGMGFGFDARVAEGINRLRWLSGFPLYLASTLLAFRGFLPPRLGLEANGLRYEGHVLMSGAGIGRFMGGGYMLFPGAEMDDGLLDTYLIEPVSFLRLAINIPKVMRGQHLTLPEVHHARAETVIYWLKEETIAQADGEVFRAGPGKIEITCERGAIRLWVPNSGLR
ncbi:MAG: diacylglycerol kinase family protein [candidate division WOR-3 bacterium]